MPLIQTPDGRYLFAIETPGEGDGNSVVYDRGVPVWDRFSYEASQGTAQPPPSPAPAPSPVPAPTPAPPLSSNPGLMQVSDESDGALLPRMYAYWSNAWVSGQEVWVFAGHEDGDPRFFRVSLITGAVSRYESMVPYRGTTEGWYWDLEGWIYLLDGPRLRRVNPFTREDRIIFDVSEMYRGCDLWQAHSSDDGRTHSATVRRIVEIGKYPYIATMVCRDGKLIPFDAQGNLDESHISGSGSDVMIEENDNLRVINIDTRQTRHMDDAEGALAHIDCGPDYMVGEADKPDPGCCALYYLNRPLTPANKVTLFLTTNMGHVSVKQGRCLLSDTEGLWDVDLQGRGRTFLRAHGMVVPPETPPSRQYDYQVKANLSPDAKVACFMSNMGGPRQDIYLLLL